MSETQRYEVHELGEDGEAWIVSPPPMMHGGSEEAARLAVVEWLQSCHAGDDFGYQVSELLRSPVTYHGHWAWHTAEPYDDALLIRLEHDHADVETFTGWLFSGHIPPVQEVSEYLAQRTGTARIEEAARCDPTAGIHATPHVGCILR